MLKNVLVGQCIDCGMEYVVEGVPEGMRVMPEQSKRNDFRVGDMIANDRNPRVKHFCCGSIASFGADGYWVTLPGASGATLIRREDAVDLFSVLMELSSDIAIVADRRCINASSKQFIGGVVDGEFSSQEKYCIRTVSGCAFLPREHAISAMDAARMIFGRCPR